MEKGVKTIKKHFFIKLCSVFIVYLTIFGTFSSVAYSADIEPYYNNVNNVTSAAEIDSNGIITITNSYSASNTVFEKAIITTYIEKRILGLFWVKVDIGQTDNEWVDTLYINTYSGIHATQLSSKGTYRVSVEYAIYGSGGEADTVIKEIEKSYS